MVEISPQVSLQHSLSPTIHHAKEGILITEDVKKKSSKRRQRGSRRHSSAATSVAENHEEKASNNHSKSSNTSSIAAAVKQQQQEKSPAFQSIVDIIHEMKRLPSITSTSDKQQDEGGSWKRVRRHSEPPHHKQPVDTKSLQTIHEAVHEQQKQPIFSNFFLALEEEEENVSEDREKNDVLVSPLYNKIIASPSAVKRIRSKSVPNNVLPRQDHTTSARKALYPAHLPVPEASAAIRASTLFSGILLVDAQDSSEAFVACDELQGESIYIFGSRNRNRALDGDEVAIELVDVDDMLNEKQSKRQARYTRRLSCISTNNALSSIPENEFDDVTPTMTRPRPKYCGKVVCILERPRNMLFSGTLSLNRPHSMTLDNGSRDKKETHPPKIIWFIPADKRLPLVAVPIKHAPTDFIKYHEEYKNRIFIGTIQRWPVTSLHPFGLIEKEVGWMGELGVHSGALMADHHIKDDVSDAAVQKQVETISFTITEKDRKGRRYLSQQKVFTMATSNDKINLDHAFSISSTEKNIFEIGIHVSDVSNYIRTNTPLDRETRTKSCSVELVDKRITILPASFRHCSLGVSGTERLAFSVLCRFTENGVLLHAWIGKTIIKSVGHVQLPMVKDERLKTDVESILKLCQKLQHIRLKQGGTSLAKSRVSFELAESGYPQKMTRWNESDQDVLLQELLIVANVEVAQKISSRFPDQALLYRQDRPKMSKLVLVQDYFENAPDTVNGLLSLIKEKETCQGKQDTLRYIMQQCTPASKYFSAGSLDISKYQHTGFSASICTTFTDPMHNYASIYVQRQLTAALKGQEQQEGDDFDVIDKIARHCNSCQLSKTAAEQDSKKLYTAAYIYRQCLDVKKVIMEAFAIRFDTDLINLYIPEYDLEVSVMLNEKSVPGACHVYDALVNEMELIWGSEKEGCTQKKKLKFLSSVEIGIHVDMKVVKPIFEIEILKQE